MSRTERLTPVTKIVGKTKTRPGCRATASFSHVGGRPTQQDACQIWENPALGATFVVLCDGVGGSRSGAEASAIVIQTAGQLWGDRGGVFTDPKRDLFSLSSVARNRIADLAVAGEKRAPASTIVALYVTATEAHWIHAGDSRLYHFRDSKVVSRTRDHSVVQILVDQGEVREEEMGSHPDQGRLLQSLGTQDYRDPTYGTAAIGPSDAFVLCTDGFWERTRPQAMASIFLAGPPHLANELRKVIDRAVRANGPSGDNVTVAIVAPLVRPREIRSWVAVKKLSPILLPMLAIMAAVGFGIFKYFGGEPASTDNQGVSKPTPALSSSPKPVPPPRIATPPPDLTPVPSSNPKSPGSSPGPAASERAPSPTPDPSAAPTPPHPVPDPSVTPATPDPASSAPRAIPVDPQQSGSPAPRSTPPPGGLQDIGVPLSHLPPAAPTMNSTPSPSPDERQTPKPRRPTKPSQIPANALLRPFMVQLLTWN